MIFAASVFETNNGENPNHATAVGGGKTDVTPAILSRDFVAQLYRATKSQV